MMLILVMAFFMLGCRFSCSGMKEDFATETECTLDEMGCDKTKIKNCHSGGFSSKAFCAKCKCGIKSGNRCIKRCR